MKISRQQYELIRDHMLNPPKGEDRSMWTKYSSLERNLVEYHEAVLKELSILCATWDAKLREWRAKNEPAALGMTQALADLSGFLGGLSFPKPEPVTMAEPMDVISALMADQSVPKCGNCGFWSVLKDHTQIGICHRFPPSAAFGNNWPEAHIDKWCGEHTPISAPEPSTANSELERLVKFCNTEAAMAQRNGFSGVASAYEYIATRLEKAIKTGNAFP